MLSSGQRAKAQNKSNGTHRHKRQTYSSGFFSFFHKLYLFTVYSLQRILSSLYQI